MSFLKSVDFYPKTAEDFRVKTLTGGAISLVSLIVIIFLVCSEFLYYLDVNRIDQLYVDTSEQKKIPIYLNITFPGISCDALSVDVMDVSGEHQISVEHTIYKQRLSLDGDPLDETLIKESIAAENKKREEEKAVAASKVKKKDYCGSCYGAESRAGECCNTCEQVKQAYLKKGWAFTPNDDVEQCYADIMDRKIKYSKKEGCYMTGHFLVSKVAGNFHFAPGKSFQQATNHVHDYLPYEVENFNTSHIIQKLSFGEPYPGIKDPLDGTAKIVKSGSALYQYFIKVVPTIYEYANGEQLSTNQYSVTQHSRPKNQEHPHVVPGVFFMYDLSPIMVHIKETRKSFLHFITSLCAIVGGVFTVSAIFDSLLYHFSQKVQQRKGDGILQ